jgi:hypothetical protein
LKPGYVQVDVETNQVAPARECGYQVLADSVGLVGGAVFVYVIEFIGFWGGTIVVFSTGENSSITNSKTCYSRKNRVFRTNKLY